MPDVTSWFIDQLAKPSSIPKRVFTLGGSDYSDRVTKWANVGFKLDELKSANPTVGCANDDGHFNYFFEDAFNLASEGGQKECVIKLGFTHAESGDELVTMYTGYLKDVKFSGKKVNFKMRDKLWNLAERVVANEVTSDGAESAAVFTNEIPTDILWTICTCYGLLDDTQGAGNTDIDWTAFETLAAIYSADNVQLSARFDGDKCQECISDVLNMTISTAWTSGTGKLIFRRLEGAIADDIVLTGADISRMDIDVSDAFMVNKQWVYGDYDTTSTAWGIITNHEVTASVNSYTLREDVMKSETVWYTDSGSCLEVAQRQTYVFSDPTKKFRLTTGLQSMYRTVGDTVRIVDAFYSVTSESAWRITEMKTNIDNGTINMKVEDSAVAVDAFIIDVSQVNDDKLLL